MFPFIHRDEPESIAPQVLKQINDAVVHFLSAREVQQFQVYTIDYKNHPVVLIQAAPQKKLRFSNILEIQIKHYLKEKLGFQAAAVFWRFKTDNSEQPGPEQADYETDDATPYSQAMSTEVATTVMLTDENSTSPSPETAINHDNYDVRHLAKKGIEVEEVMMGEFIKFLKGEAVSDKLDKPEK